jgi:TP901 family phage tail tape measure protein
VPRVSETFKQVIQIAIEALGADQAAILEKALDGIGKSGADVSGKLAPLVEELGKLEAASAKVSQAIDISDKIKANDAALTQAKAALAALNAEFQRTDKSSAEVSIAFDQAEKRVKTLSTEQLKLQTASASSAASLKASGINASNLGAAQEQLRAKIAGVAQQLIAASNAQNRFGNESKNSTTALQFLANNLGKIATLAAAMRVALAGVHFAEDAFNGAAQVEDTLIRVQATAQATQETFERFGPAIEAAARDVNVSTQEAAAGLAALVAQGQSADEALQSLVPTLRLAKIAQIDVAQAAGIVDDTLDRFGLTTASAGEVVDVLVTSSKGAKDGLAGIANAMQGIAPLARELGLSFKDTAAILGLLQQNGIDAGNAVRGLRTVFEQLQDPASKLRANLAGLGDDGSDFATAIDTISRSGDEGKRVLLDLDGASRVLVTFLAQQGSGAIAKFRENLDQSNGAAQNFVNFIKTQTSESFNALSLSVQRTTEQLAQPFLEPVAAELRKLAGEIDAFAQTPAFAEIKADLVSLANDSVKAIDGLIHGLNWKDLKDSASETAQSLRDDFHSIATNIDAIVTAMQKITAAITVFKNGADIAFDAMKVLFGGTTELAAEALLQLSKARDAIKGTVSDTTRALQQLVDQADKTRKGGLQGIATDAGEAGVALKTLAGITDEIPPRFRNVDAAVESTADKVRAIGDSAEGVDAPVQQLSGTLQNLGTQAKPAVDGLSDAVRRLGATQSDLASKAEQSRKDVDALFQGYLQGKNTIEDVRAEFAKYASDLRASVANSDQWKKDVVEDTLAVKASILGITDSFDKVGSQRIPAPDTSNVTRALDNVKSAGGEAQQALDEEQAGATEAANNISGAMGNALSAQAAFLSEFAGSSKAAVDKFTATTREFFEGAGNFSQAAIADSTGILRYGEAVAQAGKLVANEIAQQRQGVASLAAQYQGLTDAAILAKSRAGENLDALAASLRGDAAAARDGRSAFDLLGASDLGPLQSALDAAAAKVEALRQKAIDARTELDGIASSLDAEIARARGDDVGVENLRFQADLDRIKKLAKDSGTLNTEEYNRAVKRAKELHELNLENIKKENAAKQTGDNADTTGTTGTNTTGGGSGARGPGGGTNVGGGNIGTIKVDLGNGTVVDVAGNQQTAADLQNLLKKLKKAAASSGVGGTRFFG